MSLLQEMQQHGLADCADNRRFSAKDAELIAIALSHYAGMVAEDDDSFIGSDAWKQLWKLQEYFNSEANA